MKINKFKKVGKNKYKIYFDNSEIILFEDIILKYDLLIKKDMDVDLLDEVILENKYYEAYDLALGYIEVKMRNRKEIIKYLSKKEFNDNEINYALDKLDSQNLLNNKSYIVAFINDKVNLSLDGPLKIRKSLVELDFNENEIDDYLNTFDDDIWKEKIIKIINKKKSLMKSKSYFMFINKMKNDLYNMGYSSDMIDEYLSSIEYESNSLDKELSKLKRKYSDKNKIINSLLRKGYTYEEIKSKLDE
ncbi:MAG: RecX family transcriptional regulator [Bacilli bacterium]|nr:RecX family transcriptional regulator [Bacilli bacterium]